jgi:hypothetical protein
MIAGVVPWKGKKKPVTLVATVVARKISVKSFMRLAVMSPYRTTRSDGMPIRLNTRG